ncbi:MAG: hypothetical protein SFX18_04295 [Pirellulales bacterium]|nr:hypothetical protein [Pirellulales bacterium]
MTQAISLSMEGMANLSGILGFPLLLGQTLPPRYEFARLQTFTENWHYALLAVVCAAVIGFVIYMYRRDSAELHPGVGVALMFLRLVAFTGLLLHFLHLEKRDPRVAVEHSQVLVAIDSSVSMDRADMSPGGGTSGPGRLEAVIEFLKTSPWLDELRKQHEVLLYRFDNERRAIARLPKLNTPAATGNNAPPSTATTGPEPGGTAGTGGISGLNNGEYTLRPQDIRWEELTANKGTESRYGQMLREFIADQGKQPTLSALLLIGDFAHNSGLAPDIAAKDAAAAKLPVHTVGVGSAEVPVNISIADFRVPPRAYPRDKFKIGALLTARGLPRRGAGTDAQQGSCTVTADLYMKPAAADGKESADPGTLVTSQTLNLREGTEEPFEHELPGLPDPGKLTFTLVLKGSDLAKDANKADNQAQGDLEIVARSNRVLLFAGGPMREYQFLRNQLHRDKFSEVHICLQSAEEGISQDTGKILDYFPQTREELAQYDVIVAFDPNWQELTEEQIKLLDDWVAKDSGGLVLIAGPVFMDEWLQTDERTRKQLKTIRSLYPVEFDSRLSAINNSKFENETAWPIEFTPEGRLADFLWLGSTAEESEQNWQDFTGVYGFYQVRGPKPGALVYGYFSNPDASSTSGKPVYMAEQFWGSGRVFYLGSGEMWRLRRLGDGYVEQFYTKLMRHVSQGRLLRGSRQGALLLDRERYVQGSQIPLRATLQNSRYEPLEAASVEARVLLPDLTSKTVLLKATPDRPGLFSGFFNPLTVGTYQLQLPIPDTDEILTKRIQITAPQLEVDNPQRNDAVGKTIADLTGGKYYVGLADLLGNTERGVPPLASLLTDQTREKREYGVDQDFEREWLKWLMIGIVTALCLEWIIRRVCRLA